MQSIRGSLPLFPVHTNQLSIRWEHTTTTKAPRRNASPTTWDRLPATLLEAMYIYQILKQYIYIKSQSKTLSNLGIVPFWRSLKSNFVFDNGLNTLSDLCPPPYTPSVPAVHSPASSVFFYSLPVSLCWPEFWCKQLADAALRNAMFIKRLTPPQWARLIAQCKTIG